MMRRFAFVFCLLTATRCYPQQAFPASEETDSLPQKHAGMRYVPGGAFLMGATDDEAGRDEFPAHSVIITGFWMDTVEVTNAAFGAFVKATGYITTAERQLSGSIDKPGAVVFQAASGWQWTPGANWRHPLGPGSDIAGKEHHPVVQVSWEDAIAYCRWAGKRLPTEAEWEYAARGGLRDMPYPWGIQSPATGPARANIWDGDFPFHNTQTDGYLFTAPVAQYAPNGYGLYDMAGNVWEWCSDWYDEDLYDQLADSIATDPKGPVSSVTDANDKVIRGGSFLCHNTYCTGYRVSRRMYTPAANSLLHTGFRCVKDARP